MVFMPHWPVPNVKNNIMLGLDRMHSMLERLGNPHLSLPKVIHVAGTNGKGSTTAYMKEILTRAGFVVHRYISPHLMHFNERIELRGAQISDAELYKLLEEVRVKTEGIHTTFFEGTTAAAFLAFSRVEADFLILEVGMGGRLDATNVVDNVALSIVTPISYDHVEYLGDTIAKIAYEKAGIIKKGCPCVFGWQMKEAMDVLVGEAERVGAPYCAWGIDWDFDILDSGFLVRYMHDTEPMILPTPSLQGIHQVLNASAVAVACEKYLQVDAKYIYKGIANTNWPGRLEQIRSGVLYDLLPEGFELWIDGAHNTGGAQMVAAHVINKWSDKDFYLINGRTGDRDIAGFLEYFKGITKALCAVRVISEPSGERAEKIADVASSMGIKSYACQDIRSAVETIVNIARAPARILITGSLYLAGDAKMAR